MKLDRDRIQLAQFCAYGFLKNQQYFEPFFLLALLEKTSGYSQAFALTWVGLLFGFRDICINLLEIPSGAAADVLGRRRTMIAGFSAYVISFLIFGLAQPLWSMFVAMFFFACGDAFRTGTHKAMIFQWLARQGRQDEKTAVYGLTRSWSKLGSALSALIAAAMVFWTGSFSAIFLVCLVPYAASIVNFLFYPRYLDGENGNQHRSVAQVVRTLWQGVRDCIDRGPLRRLVVEAAGYEGLHKASKHYLQLIIQVVALLWLAPKIAPLLQEMRGSDNGEVGLLSTALLIGPIYFVLFLLGSIASRKARTLVARAGSEDRAARWLWAAELAIFAVLGAGVATGQYWLAIAAFVVLTIMENFWRPIMVSRFADRADPSRQATILSVESQAKSLFAAAAAPALAFSIDMLHQGTDSQNYQYLPLAVLGLTVSAAILLTGRKKP